jgi:excisionase family DNA binding protein
LAERWDVSPSHVRKLLIDAEIENYRIGKLIRIPAHAVESYEARNPSLGVKECDVYIIRCGGYIKIGKASKVQSRVSSIQSMNPHPVDLVKALGVADGTAVERLLHARFLKYLHRGEWFREEGDLADWIKGGCPL